MKKLGLIVLLVGLVVSACGLLTPESGLAGTTWRLVEMDNQPLIPGTEITLTFESDEQLGGMGGCNHYGGSFTISPDGSFRVGEIAANEMACITPEGVLEQEYIYFEILHNAATWKLDGDLLILQGAGGGFELVFQVVSPR